MRLDRTMLNAAVAGLRPSHSVMSRATKGELCEMNASHHPQAQSIRQRESQGPETTTGFRAIKVGLFGSLAGTLVMDLIMVVESLIMGEPVDGFAALIGSVVGDGALVGAVIHLSVGSLLGLLFGAAVWRVRLLRIESVRKGVWLGLLAGLVTIPLGCVPFAVITGVPIAEMVSFSFIPHLVWGAVLGAIAGCALRPNPLSCMGPASEV